MFEFSFFALFEALRPSQHFFSNFGLTGTKQWKNVTCSRPQRTANRPGLEPGTTRSEVR